MTVTPRLRKFALTAHVTSSVGWLGAVAAFLALAVAGLTGQNSSRGASNTHSRPESSETGLQKDAARAKRSGGSNWMHSLRASPVFSLVVLVTLGVAGLIGLMVLLMQLQPGFMGMAHFTEPHHRIHDLTFGFLFGTGVVGLLAQLRRPTENVAGQLMALIPWVALVLTSALTNAWRFAPLPILGALTLLATILHPTGRDLFSSFSASRVDRVMLALVIIAAVPLLAFATTNIGLQRTVTNDHAALGHYAFMAAFSLTVIGVGLLASVRPDGWWLPAWVAGFLPALLGFASMVFPNVDSSLGLVWALAAIAWGVGFVAAAEFIRRSGRTHPGRAGQPPDRGSIPSTPRWVYVFGIIVVVLGLLFGILHLTGGGPGLHTP